MRSHLRQWSAFLAVYFFDAFVIGFTRHLLLVAILVLVAGLLAGWLATELGASLLLWHEDWYRQLLAGFVVGLLLAKVFFVGFLLDGLREDRRWRRWLPVSKDRLDALQPLDEGRYYLAGAAGVVFVMALAVTTLRVMSLRAARSMSGAPMMTGSFVGLQGRQYLPLPTGLLIAAAVVGYATGRLAKWSRLKPPPRHLELRNAAAEGYELLPAPTTVPRPTAGTAHRRAPGRGRDRQRWWEWLLLLGVRDVDRDGRRLHFVAGLLFLLELLVFVLTPILTPRYLATPATAICTLLGLVASIYGAARYRVRNSAILIATVLLLLWAGGQDPFKVRIPGLDDAAYRSPAALAYTVEPVADLVRFEQTRWAPGRKAPLVIACASGGGVRAMVWTGAILSELERKLPGFPYHVRLIAGASGGMVGAAYYVETLRPPDWTPLEQNFHHDVPQGAFASPSDAMAHNLGADFLSEVIKVGVFTDLPLTLWPWPKHDRVDRGRALEQSWIEHLGTGFGTTSLGDLAPGEREGWRPSLVFSPMMVEDGRRLLISNLDLDFMTVTRGPRLGEIGPPAAAAAAKGATGAGVGAGGADAVYSRSAYELSRLFPAVRPRLPLVSAARLSASFPYFSPAAQLPTSPRRRVVDAGYFDNYGVTVATAWLNHLLDTDDGVAWLRNNVSGVVIVQIRDGVSSLAGDVGARPGADSPMSRGFEWLTSPIEGVMASRDSISLFRNDVQLERLRTKFSNARSRLGLASEAQPAEDYFTTVAFENPEQVSLSWYLTKRELSALLGAARAHPNIAPLLEWWSRHDRPARK